MSGHGGFSRNGLSHTRNMQDTLESDPGLRALNYLDSSSVPSASYGTSTLSIPTFNLLDLNTKWPLQPDFPINFSMQDTSTHTLSSKMN